MLVYYLISTIIQQFLLDNIEFIGYKINVPSNWSFYTCWIHSMKKCNNTVQQLMHILYICNKFWSIIKPKEKYAKIVLLNFCINGTWIFPIFNIFFTFMVYCLHQTWYPIQNLLTTFTPLFTYYQNWFKLVQLIPPLSQHNRITHVRGFLNGITPSIQNPRLLKPSTATQKPEFDLNVNILPRIGAYFAANTSATEERLSLRWIQLSVPEYPVIWRNRKLP